MWRKLLSLGLAFGLLCGPLSALPSQPPYLSAPSSSATSSVVLSEEEYSAILAAMETAKNQLAKSNETIATQSQRLTQTKSNLEASNLLIEKQSKDLTMLWIFCAVLGSALVLDAAADIIIAVKK